MDQTHFGTPSGQTGIAIGLATKTDIGTYTKPTTTTAHTTLKALFTQVGRGLEKATKSGISVSKTQRIDGGKTIVSEYKAEFETKDAKVSPTKHTALKDFRSEECYAYLEYDDGTVEIYKEIFVSLEKTGESDGYVLYTIKGQPIYSPDPDNLVDEYLISALTE